MVDVPALLVDIVYRFVLTFVCRQLSVLLNTHPQIHLVYCQWLLCGPSCGGGECRGPDVEATTTYITVETTSCVLQKKARSLAKPPTRRRNNCTTRGDIH